MTKQTARILLAGTALIWSGAAEAGSDPAAAEAGAAGPMETIIVTAARLDEAPVVAMARHDLSRTPGAVAIIASETYKDRFATGFSDLLRNVPGVLAQKRYGEESRLSIRGSGISQPYHQRGVLIAQDGVPFADADGFSDFQKVDALSARYIEVYKGGNALRFGGAQLGGALNLVTPTGRTAPDRTMLRVEGGSYDTLRGRVSLAREGERWDVYAAAAALTSDGYRQWDDQSQVRATLNLGYKLSDDADIRVIAYGADINQDVPGTLSLNDALHNPKSVKPAVVAGAWARDQQIWRVSIQADWRLSEALRLTGGVYQTATDLHHPISLVIDQDVNTSGAFARFDWSGTFAGKRTDVFWGAFYRHGHNEQKLYVNALGERGFQFGDSRQTASGLDLFMEARWFVLPELAMVAGGSYGRATRRYFNHLSPANDDHATFDWLAPRIGLLWENEHGAQVYANLTRSVEPPHYGALVQSPHPGFVPVDAQKAWTGELGTRGQVDALTWDVAAFRSEIKGELLSFQMFGLPSAFFNADDTVHQGLELSLDWQVAEDIFASDRLLLKQSYTYSDFRFRDDPAYGDGRLPVVPKHQYRIEVKYSHAAGFFMAPAIEWRISKPYADYANTLKVPAYALVSLSAGWTITDHVSAFLDLRNLTGKKYAAEFGAVTNAALPSVSTDVFYPGEGRAGYLGLTVGF